MSIPIFEGGHISESEISCPCCGFVWPDIFTDPVYRSFFDKLETLRSATGFPIIINKGGGCRCPRYQRSLITARRTDAVFSPHFFMAIDWDVDTPEDVQALVRAAEERFPDLRMGYAQYLNRRQTFVHFDEAYLFDMKPRPLGIEAWVRKTRW